jgi:hypothetical protein
MEILIISILAAIPESASLLLNGHGCNSSQRRHLSLSIRDPLATVKIRVV